MAPEPERGAELTKIRRLLRVVLGTASAVFVAYACWELVGRWESGKVKLDLALLLASLVPLGLGTVILALGWKWLLERMISRPVPAGPAVALHLESQLARYMPGKVGMPLVRIAGAERLGASAGAVGSSVFVELLPFLSVGGAVGFLCLWLGSSHARGALEIVGRWGVFGLAGFGAATLVLVVVDRKRYPSAALRLLRAEGDAALVPARVPAAHFAYWLTWALHGYLASRAVGVTHSAAIAGAGLYVLAPIAGFLAFLAPSGIGVREAVLSLGLAPTLGPAPAVAAAIVSRLSSIAVDVLAWAAARAATRSARAS